MHVSKYSMDEVKSFLVGTKEYKKLFLSRFQVLGNKN